MFLSRRCIYGLQALSLLAEYRTPLLSREIALILDIPSHFLAKILQDLAKEGLLHSSRGKGGGFRLAQPAGKITLRKVIETLEGKRVWNRCVFGTIECLERDFCPLHAYCTSLKEETCQIFSRLSVKQIIERQDKMSGRVVKSMSNGKEEI